MVETTEAREPTPWAAIAEVAEWSKAGVVTTTVIASGMITGFFRVVIILLIDLVSELLTFMENPSAEKHSSKRLTSLPLNREEYSINIRAVALI